MDVLPEKDKLLSLTFTTIAYVSPIDDIYHLLVAVNSIIEYSQQIGAIPSSAASSGITSSGTSS
jgi:hypothetical protein